MYLKSENLGFDLVALWQSNMHMKCIVLKVFATYTIIPETAGVVAVGS